MAKRKPAKKPRKKSPWPRGWRMHPHNDALATLVDGHPAKRLLFAHARCRRECAGREIPWPGREAEAFDQEFNSSTDLQRWTFSGWVYAHVCFSLVLTEWLTHPPQITESERQLLLEHLPRIRGLLIDCRAAAERDNNPRVLKLLPVADDFIEAWDLSIRARLAADGITIPSHLP